jgi:sugar phosphate isomerase/epimerase
MAVDVHYGGIIETVADCEYLLSCAQKRNAGLCLNIGHMTTLGEEGWSLLERRPDRVHALAWKDHLIGDDLPQPVVSVELGKGKSPFHRYADVLKRVRCNALHYITFEHVPFEEKKDALRRSREYLAQLLEG